MRTECISDFVSLGGKTYPCPISVAMDLVGGKWKAVILYHLQHGPKRFGELRRALISPTEAVLSNQLRQLERDGLVSREVFGSKPPVKTVYSLTEFGRTFLPALTALTEWGNRGGASNEVRMKAMTAGRGRLLVSRHRPSPPPDRRSKQSPDGR